MFAIYDYNLTQSKQKDKPATYRCNNRYILLGSDDFAYYGDFSTTSSSFCHIMPEYKCKLQHHGKKILTAHHYNYRLQLLSPCYYCIFNKQHPKSSKSSHVRIYTRMTQLLPWVKQTELLEVTEEEEKTWQMTEMSWLIAKVRRYEETHQ